MATANVVRVGSQPGTGRMIFSVVIESGDTEGETTLPFNGTVMNAFVHIPNITGTTATVIFEDEDDAVYHNTGALADNKEGADAHKITPGFSATGDLTVRATASAQGADQTIKVVIIYY